MFQLKHILRGENCGGGEGGGRGDTSLTSCPNLYYIQAVTTFPKHLSLNCPTSFTTENMELIMRNVQRHQTLPPKTFPPQLALPSKYKAAVSIFTQFVIQTCIYLEVLQKQRLSCTLDGRQEFADK